MASAGKNNPSSASSLNHGEYSPASRALALGSYFVSGCMAINASQFLGFPLYLINEDWYNTWIAFTKQSWGLLTTSMTQCWAPTVVKVSGDKSVRGQLLANQDGNLSCNFPDRLILIANHQIYTDWLYLWWIGYTGGMHGHIYIVLKESLRRIPILGWGMQFCQFIFLKRDWELDKPRLASHLQKLNKESDPMWLMMFPEGTNLAPSTREASKKWAIKNKIRDLRHLLLPRSTGLQFCLQELRNTVGYVYDCTIAYEGVPRGQYAQDIFTLQASYLGGRPPKSVNMYWRRFPISSIPLDNAKNFETWLRARWVEKDELLEGYLRTGRFPADRGIDIMRNGTNRKGSGYIETEIKPNRWYEFLQVFAPISVIALVLYLFYGALPSKIIQSLDKQRMLDKHKFSPKVRAQDPGKEQLVSQLAKRSCHGSSEPEKQLRTENKGSSSKATPKDVRVDVSSQETQTKVANLKSAPLKNLKVQKVAVGGRGSQTVKTKATKKQQASIMTKSPIHNSKSKSPNPEEPADKPEALSIRTQSRKLNNSHKPDIVSKKLATSKLELGHQTVNVTKDLKLQNSGGKRQVDTAPKQSTTLSTKANQALRKPNMKHDDSVSKKRR